MTETFPDVVRHAETAQEAIRAMGRTAPEVLEAANLYSLLGELKQLGALLPDALERLSEAHGRSLDVFDVYEDDGSEPALKTSKARGHLRAAANLADQLYRELDAAQQAIEGQANRGPKPNLTPLN